MVKLKWRSCFISALIVGIPSAWFLGFSAGYPSPWWAYVLVVSTMTLSNFVIGPVILKIIK